MNEYINPPVRFDSGALDARRLAQQIDWGQRERNMPEIWNRTSGAGVLVIILDTGVPQHQDLPTAVFASNFSDSATPFDRNGHQTHCAGIVAATNNEDGVVGWAPGADLGHIKVLGDRGSGTSTWIAEGIRAATREWQNRKNDYVGCIISMSLGGGYDADQERAIIEANRAEILVVAAAGNSGFRPGQSTVDHPGASEHTLGVAAYRRSGEIAEFSSSGPQVDIAMPGEEILSTFPGQQYRVMSGTSMATPAAAGLLACILSSRPHDSSIRNLKGMREFLAEHSEDRGQLGKDNRFGFGVPNAAELVRNPEYWFF